MKATSVDQDLQVQPPTQREVLHDFGKFVFTRLLFLKWLYRNHKERVR
jgi:hypothetical protein